MITCLMDTGPMVALFDAGDRYHDRAVEFIRNFSGTFVTSLANVTETVYLLDFDQRAQCDFLTWIGRGAVEVRSVDNTKIADMTKIFKKYADLPMDFPDGCLISLAESLHTNVIASIDSDFNIYRVEKNSASSRTSCFENIF